MNSGVVVERRGRVAVLVLNRPDKLNAWDAGMRIEIIDRLKEFRDDTSVSGIVVTGAGRGFCAGQDLSETAKFDAGDSAAAREWVNGFASLYRAVLDIDKPVVGAVNGVAAGSGFQFALLLDLRLGHAGVRMGQPEVLSGIPSITGCWAMLPILGRARTVELALTGRLVYGHEAHDLGLLNRLVDEDDVVSQSVLLAAEMGSLPNGAFRETKKYLQRAYLGTIEQAVESAVEIHGIAYATGEPQRHMERFI